MSLQSKFFAYFLTIALTPLLIVGFFSVVEIEKQITRSTVDHLSSVANLQEARLNEIISGYLQEVKLVTSKTQLRLSFAEYSESNNSDALTKMSNILADTKDSISNIQSISVIDLSGNIVASTDKRDVGSVYEQSEILAQGQKRHTIARVFKDADNLSRGELVGPLRLENQTLGMVSILIDIDSLIAVTEDYTGLGQTGEVVIAKKNGAGDALFLTPLRFDAGAALTRAVAKENVKIPIIPAVNGTERVYVENDTIDYRETPVIAVTRFLDAVEWGLVAKIDQNEALAEVLKYRSTFLFMALFVIFIVVALSFFISNSFASPLLMLVFKAKALEKGDFSSPIVVSKRDEIGRLGEAFNTMASKLQESYATMEKKVRDRTAEVSDTLDQLEKKNMDLEDTKLATLNLLEDLESEKAVLANIKAKDEAMLASIGDGLVATDSKGRIVLVNKAFTHLLGFEENEVQGKMLVDIIETEADDHKPVPKKERSVTEALEKHTTTNTTNTNLIYKKKDGTFIPVATTISPIMVGSEIVGAVEVFRDITKEREVDEAKTEFVSLASHQLRTPLSAVNWYAEMLLAGDAGELNAEQKKFLEEIYIGNQRMVDLVNALLNVSRLELGTFIVEPKKLNVMELAKSVQGELKPLVSKKSVNLTESHADNIPEIFADPKLVRIVIQNLLSNAVKYTPENGSVEYHLGHAKRGETFGAMKIRKESITITVKDTGLGIPKAEQSKMFTKLFRADNVRKTDTEGTGLGLYIVKSIVEKSGGKIWFESPVPNDIAQDKNASGGTVFYVTLPVAGMKKKEGTKPLA